MASTPTRMRAPALFLAVALTAGCGDSTGPDGQLQVIEETVFAASLNIDLSRMTLAGHGIYIEDLTVGTGDPAVLGTRVQVSYTGWLSDGTVFDAGAFPFSVGTGQVIQGFDEGVSGMQVGGKRKVIIPPELGYGTVAKPTIPAGSILIFDIELVSIG